MNQNWKKQHTRLIKHRGSWLGIGEKCDGVQTCSIRAQPSPIYNYIQNESLLK